MNARTFLFLFCLGVLVSCASHVETRLKEKDPWEGHQNMPELR
jgi:hypothetical protein